MRKLHVACAAMAVVLIPSIAWLMRAPVAAQDKPAQVLQKWEYKVEALSTRALHSEEKKLNKLGSEGWELCATERDGSREEATWGNTYTVFKRPMR